VPISIVGAFSTFPPEALMPYGPKGKDLAVHFHPPIETDGRTDEEVTRTPLSRTRRSRTRIVHSRHAPHTRPTRTLRRPTLSVAVGCSAARDALPCGDRVQAARVVQMSLAL
jgi:hypothetical protein